MSEVYTAEETKPEEVNQSLLAEFADSGFPKWVDLEEQAEKQESMDCIQQLLNAVSGIEPCEVLDSIQINEGELAGCRLIICSGTYSFIMSPDQFAQMMLRYHRYRSEVERTQSEILRSRYEGIEIYRMRNKDSSDLRKLVRKFFKRGYQSKSVQPLRAEWGEPYLLSNFPAQVQKGVILSFVLPALPTDQT